MVESAHLVWSQPEERRRMRFFGFRPAVEPGVLKREWHQLAVRLSPEALRARHPDLGDVAYLARERALLVNDAPLQPDAESMELVRQLLDLIQSYERWVEAREGRAGRINRGQDLDSSRSSVNPLAETRRLQRTMQTRRRGRG